VTTPKSRDATGRRSDLAAHRMRLLAQRSLWRLAVIEALVVGVRAAMQFNDSFHGPNVLLMAANVSLLAPVLYGAKRLGLAGSLGAALVEVAALGPIEAIHRDQTWQVWGGGGALFVALVVGLVAGQRSAYEARHQARLAEIERARLVGNFEGEALSWRGLFEALPFGVALLDDVGVIRFVNDPLLRASGRARREVVGRSIDEIVAGVRVSTDALVHEGAIVERNTPVDVEFAPLRFAGTNWTIAFVRDASARVEAERARHEAEHHAREAEMDRARDERRFRLAFTENTSGMAIVDGEGVLLDVNQAYCDMLGVRVEELVGRHVNEMTHPEDRELTADMIGELVRGERPGARYVKRYVHREGHVIFGELSVGVVRADDGHLEGVVASIKDVTDERALMDQLSHQALHDPLTGLANRALFQDRLARAIELRARHGGVNALFLLDLNDFKGVNDSMGHHVGDELLVEISRRLEEVTRTTDTLCRYGGDEFLYLAEGLSGEADEVAERLLAVFDEPFLTHSLNITQHASLGVVIDDGEPLEAHELLRDVDTAMYEAKRRGTRRPVTFTAQMKDQVSERYQLRRDLRRALALDEISMVYQPLVNLITDEVVGFEALMRWQHPSFGAVSPAVFIELAEQSELIIELGEYALMRACEAAASWPVNSRGRYPHVSVNLSTRQFHDPHLAATIERALVASGLSSQRLVLEITESATLSDVAGAQSLVEDLERLGVVIALDDFGTGYSSLSYLAHLKPVIIKIDRSFVQPIHSALDTNPLLESIIAFGHQLGLSMVAEGIETESQLEYLRHVGCDYGQGFLFASPMTGEAVHELLRADEAHLV
jgi:diguanylate cyclase (GGDEF)-like protein/PAS domain S-box-containing protein